MKNEKIMHFANFNITFGSKEEPMLTHFEDIILPAFISDYKRGKEDEYPIFSFSDVQIKEAENGEYVLVGNYIKDTKYTVHTTLHNGELKSSPAQVPTAPYSRFIIFLKNHRMILVRNEPLSPDIRSFQATVRTVLNKYISTKNKEAEEKNSKRLPYAIVNIVDIPLKDDIETILKEVATIKWVKLRFFPLNNDINPLPVAQAITDEMKRVGSKTGNATFNSPESKSGVQKMIEDTAGLAVTTMEVIDIEGDKRKIKEGSFTSNKPIAFARDIQNEDDKYIISEAKKNELIKRTSDANEALYNRFKVIISNLIK